MAQTLSFNGRRRVRKFFGKIPEVAEMPNLIEVQKASYDQFLHGRRAAGRPPGRGPAGRLQVGVPDHRFLRARRCWNSCRYEFEPPKFDVDECRQRDLTYAAPLKVTLRLIVFDIDEDTGAKSDQGHQGAGRLHGRHAAHDRQRHLHRQRHRARHRLPDAPFAGRVLRPRQGQDATPRASCCSPPASSRIAAPGSTSSSTPRTSSTPVSTAAARSR